MKFLKICDRRIPVSLLATHYLLSAQLLQTVHEVSQLPVIGAIMFMSEKKKKVYRSVGKVIASLLVFFFKRGVELQCPWIMTPSSCQVSGGHTEKIKPTWFDQN